MENFEPKVGQRVVYRGGVITKVEKTKLKSYPWRVWVEGGIGEGTYYTNSGGYCGNETVMDIVELIDMPKLRTFEEFLDAGLLREGMRFKDGSNKIFEIIKVRENLFYSWNMDSVLFSVECEPASGTLSATLVEE